MESTKKQKKKTRRASQYQLSLIRLLEYIDTAPSASRSHQKEPIDDENDRLVYTWQVGDYQIDSSLRIVGEILPDDKVLPKFSLRKKDLHIVFEHCKKRQSELLKQLKSQKKK